MKNNLKNILNNKFLWHTITAIFSIVLTGCYVWEDEFILAVCWGIIAGSNIAMAWLERK